MLSDEISKLAQTTKTAHPLGELSAGAIFSGRYQGLAITLTPSKKVLEEDEVEDYFRTIRGAAMEIMGFLQDRIEFDLINSPAILKIHASEFITAVAPRNRRDLQAFLQTVENNKADGPFRQFDRVWTGL